MRNKEAARSYYTDVIKSSWTYARLTDGEREALAEVLKESTPVGTFLQRCDVLAMIYAAFLAGLGYRSIGWRETDPEAPKF